MVSKGEQCKVDVKSQQRGVKKPGECTDFQFNLLKYLTFIHYV